MSDEDTGFDIGPIIQPFMDQLSKVLTEAFDKQREKIAALEEERDTLTDEVEVLEEKIADLEAPGQGPENAYEISRHDNNPGVALIEKRFDGTFGCAWCGREISDCHERMEAGKCREMP